MKLLWGIVVFVGFYFSLEAEPIALGTVYKDTEVALDIAFTPSAADTAPVSRVESSCGCLKLLALPGPAKPGQTTQIPFTYRSSNTGKVSVQISVYSGDKILRTFDVSGFVCERDWIVRPDTLPDSAVIVDVRSKAAFSGVHIPHSINLPLFSLKLRSDLREKPVVLVDEGFNQESCLDVIKDLRAAGFAHINLLSGGLPAWLESGKKVEGTVSSPQLYAATITPAEYERSAQSSPWLQFIVRTPHGAEAKEAIDLKRLGALVAQEVPLGRVCQKILVVASDTAVYDRVLREFKSSSSRIFFLQGGEAAWTAYNVEQRALAAKTGQLFSVRPTQGRPIVAGGSKPCGTCGSK